MSLRSVRGLAGGRLIGRRRLVLGPGLSLDVEGFEYEILSTFPFNEYQFGCMGIERPPEQLTLLLEKNGYQIIARAGEDTFYVPIQSSFAR